MNKDFHHGNICWQSDDKSWNLGFFHCHITTDRRSNKKKYDYDLDRFEWVTRNHPSPSSAWSEWPGVKPEGGWYVYYVPGFKLECKKYERMADELDALLGRRSA